MRATKVPRVFWFLARAHKCNYCHAVRGVTFDRPPKVRARLIRAYCPACKRRHYVCHGCAGKVGVSVARREPSVGECARGYLRRHKIQVPVQDSKGGV